MCETPSERQVQTMRSHEQLGPGMLYKASGGAWKDTFNEIEMAPHSARAQSIWCFPVVPSLWSESWTQLDLVKFACACPVS